ncbi:multicopper oxidase LPR2 isoform X2 [Elaeis guineensis]|uniref:Multicopper oxidase LPR2 isoform X2 n=1 Tax=Elaeis guineensis var. tenera TaxID=51953 RepID=A0A6I9RGV5_ELAGV|nr:multicopper oxidase LPR2 isoform X2 [Elaeis guineensis]
MMGRGRSAPPRSRCSWTSFPICPGSEGTRSKTAFRSPVISPSACTKRRGSVPLLPKFHRDLPASRVFAFGTSKETATVPGPTIEGLQGVPTHVTWTNYLPSRHILPWDPTLSAPRPRTGGVPTVVHRHGGVHPPHSDGHSFAWFTSSFSSTGPKWSRPTFSYPNAQPPGSLWYHDHAMALTRVNLLAGLFGAYSLLAPALESPLRLPSGPQFDLPLVVFDRSFLSDGSIYMNSTGNNPDIHPQWQPEYFGDAIIVNGKAWPFLAVRRRRYRFRIINASNARFFRFFFTNGLRFVHVASDSVYLPRPVSSKKFLLAPSEIADVIVDFSQSANDSAILANDAPYPYPSGDPADEINGRVMKFVIGRQREVDSSRIPESLLRYPAPAVHQVAETRYIAMYEYESATGEPTRLYLNGKSFMEPATETPREGSSEVWHVINLTDDNHPLHIHLAVFVVLEQRELVDEDRFKDCMMKLNDAIKCRVEDHAIGKRYSVPRYERGWKNVFKMRPGCVTKILVRFSPLEPEMGTYPFNSTEEPGYVYHCHILDHEDNEMMRPLKLIP